MRAASSPFLAVASLLLGACAAGGDEPATVVPGTVETEVATDLAPSQLVGSTVPEPATPGPCDVADLEFWTAQVRPGDGVVDAVVRVHNAGPVWCEVDLGGSPRVDPAIEPDVWLAPGGAADLVVGREPGDCASPAVTRRVQLAVGGVPVEVGSAVVACGWWLTAFSPIDDATVRCDVADLESVATERAVLLRNRGFETCSVGDLERDGASVLRSPTPGPAVRTLAPGDVVALGRPGGVDCAGSPGRVTLHGVATDDVLVDDVPCGLVFEPGPPRPWYGAPDGALAAIPTDDVDVASILEALDPFGLRE